MIELREAYRYYIADPANRAAVDFIISSEDIPDGLDFDEWAQYQHVHLASERVKTELYLLLHQVWTETWGSALASHLPQSELARSGETDAEASLSSVWRDRSLGNYAKLSNGSYIWLGTELHHNQEVTLWFYLEDASGGFGWSDNMNLTDLWNAVDDDNVRTTKGRLCIITKDSSAIDIQILREASFEVAQKISQDFL